MSDPSCAQALWKFDSYLCSVLFLVGSDGRAWSRDHLFAFFHEDYVLISGSRFPFLALSAPTPETF